MIKANGVFLMSVNPGCFCRGHNKNGLYTVGDMTRQWGFPGWGDQSARSANVRWVQLFGIMVEAQEEATVSQIPNRWALVDTSAWVESLQKQQPKSPGRWWRSFKFVSSNIWPIFGLGFEMICLLSCERVSRWSIVLKAFRGSQRWGRSSPDGIDGTSELVILWASFAWIYVNFHVWTAEIPIFATGVWIPKGVLTLTTPEFYMLSLYMSRFRSHLKHIPLISHTKWTLRQSKTCYMAIWNPPWWALFHESWIIYQWWIFMDFPLACHWSKKRAITKSLVFIMGEVPYF